MIAINMNANMLKINVIIFLSILFLNINSFKILVFFYSNNSAFTEQLI